jgi:hypothetical protein
LIFDAFAITFDVMPSILNPTKVERLKTIMRSDERAGRVLRLVMGRSLRGRAHLTTDLRRIVSELNRTGERDISIQEIRQLFLRLQKDGFGSIIMHKKGNEPDRFQWDYSLNKIREAVGATVPNIAPVPNRLNQDGHITLPYPIGGRIVHLTIPHPMTKEEAQDLGEYIKRFGL